VQDLDQIALRLRNIHKTFEQNNIKTQVLGGIDVVLHKGEVVALVGPNGCGKTTLVKIIAKALQPDERVAREVYGSIGVVFQNHRLLPWLTVEENIGLPLQLKNGNEPKPPSEYVQDLLSRTGLAAMQHGPIKPLSGGQRQMVAILRALCTDPAILVMDEPFSALDERNRGLFRKEVEMWRKGGKALFLVTHDPEEAAFLADRVLVLSRRPSTVRKEIPIGIPHIAREAAKWETTLTSITRELERYLR